MKLKKALKLLLLSCGLLAASLYFPWGVLGEYGGMFQGAIALSGLFGLLKALDLIDTKEKKEKKKESK